MSSSRRRRSAAVAAAAVGALVVVSAAMADTPVIRYRAADQAAAKAIVLSAGDLRGLERRSEEAGADRRVV